MICSFLLAQIDEGDSAKQLKTIKMAELKKNPRVPLRSSGLGKKRPRKPCLPVGRDYLPFAVGSPAFCGAGSD